MLIFLDFASLLRNFRMYWPSFCFSEPFFALKIPSPFFRHFSGCLAICYFGAKLHVSAFIVICQSRHRNRLGKSAAVHLWLLLPVFIQIHVETLNLCWGSRVCQTKKTGCSWILNWPLIIDIGQCAVNKQKRVAGNPRPLSNDSGILAKSLVGSQVFVQPGKE